MKSVVLVFVQFFIIFLMILPFGAQTCCFTTGMVLIGLGLFIGLAALVQNKLGNFNIRPDIKEGCTLITTGIYRYIRHPMYTSVLVMMLGVVALYFSPYEVVLYTILVIDLIIKLLYEEKLWSCNSQEYKTYMKTTSRLIPKIF